MTEVTGRVHGKVCIVGDDVTTTGGTLIAGARALREHGAREVWVYVTHALLEPRGARAPGRRGGHHRHRRHRHGARSTRGSSPENLTVLTVAPLLAETIINVFSDDSVSAIFGGENQLF